MLERIDHALFDRRDVVSRHDAAGNAVLELEAVAARQRLDFKHHIAELAVTAGLLLVTATLRDRLADGLAVTHGGRPRRNRHHEALGKTFGCDPKVHFALSPDHHFVAFRVVHDG